MREVVEARRQRVAFEHLGAHAENDALQARLLGVLADGQQRLLERQAGFDERRELARQQRQVEPRNASEQRELALRLALARLDLGDLDGQELRSRSSWRTWRGVSPSRTPRCSLPPGSTATY